MAEEIEPETAPNLTPDPLPELEAIMTQAREQMEAQQAAKAAEIEARRSLLAPLRAIVGRPEFDGIIDDLKGERSAFMDDANLWVHVNAVIDVLSRFKLALAREPE